jgi:hypothetical protein
MDAQVRHLALDSGDLVAINGLEAPADRFVTLAFQFAKGTLFLRCDDDTDEILVEVVEDEPGYAPVANELLASLIGSTIEYAWVLTNHRGYEDSFQLRLASPRGHHVTVQLEVGASAMDVRRVAG